MENMMTNREMVLERIGELAGTKAYYAFLAYRHALEALVEAQARDFLPSEVLEIEWARVRELESAVLLEMLNLKDA